MEVILVPSSYTVQLGVGIITVKFSSDTSDTIGSGCGKTFGFCNVEGFYTDSLDTVTLLACLSVNHCSVGE